MRRTRAAAVAALLGFAASIANAAPSATLAQSGATTPRAILVRGADQVKGLPFFPPNALPALVGAYRPAAEVTSAAATAATDETVIWFTREPLVLGPTWKRSSLEGAEYFLLARPSGTVLALKKSAYYLFFGLPAGAAPEDPSRLSFVRGFDRKFSAFMTNAPTEAEISFPAYVDY